MRKILITIVCVFSISLLYGQLTFTGQNQILIEEAIKDGFFVIHRCYQLKDTDGASPSYYGWNNLPYFGATYSLGIKVAEGYFLTDKAFRPWMYDSRFEEYAGNSRYTPVLSTSAYRLPEDTVYHVLPDSVVMIKEIAAHRVYLAQDTALFRQKGFSVDSTIGVKKGWLVWVVTDKPIAEKPDQAFSYLIYRTELTFEAGKESYEIRDPATSQYIVGGFYILPEVMDIGNIVFHLTGMLHHENGKWMAVRVSHSISSNVIQPQPSGGSLTPIKTRNK